MYLPPRGPSGTIPGQRQPIDKHLRPLGIHFTVSKKIDKPCTKMTYCVKLMSSCSASSMNNYLFSHQHAVSIVGMIPVTNLQESVLVVLLAMRDPTARPLKKVYIICA